MSASSGDGSQRRRGVRASRAKLTRALTDAGLRTQAALAERIADLEGLDAAPKDTVNRAFRELPVELQTLQRIARALGVEAWTLYLGADEAVRGADESGRVPSGACTSAGGMAPATAVPGAAADTPVLTGASRARPGRGAAPAALLALVALAIAGATGLGWLLAARDGADPAPAASSGRSRPALSLGAPRLLVMPFDGDRSGALAAALRDALARDFAVAEDTASVLTRNLTPADAAQRLRTDAAVAGEIVTVGRRTGIRLFVHADGVRQPVWAESLPAVGLTALTDAIAARGASAIRALLRDAAGGAGGPGHFPLAPVQDVYLQGWSFLDRPASELNIKRARSHFETVLRQDANYARAHAALCQALLAEHWMGNEERALEDAAHTCGQALQLDPADPVVRTAHARFLSRTGRNEGAIALYREIVAAHPRDADALEGLASAHLKAFRHNGDEAQLHQAIGAARAATDADPSFWRPPFTLATLHWFAGHLDAAIAASEEARARDENEFVLANLGTWYVCRGDFEQGRDAYERARELAPQSYVGDEFLGLTYYLLGDYERSAKLRQRAVEAVGAGEPEIHQMWGALADSYARAGNPARARDAYLRAAEILERDHLRGTAPAADRAARAYYYLKLREMEPAVVPEGVVEQAVADLDAVADGLNDATGYRRLAQVWLLLGQRARAGEALAAATATCPGYAGFPDLAPLRGEHAPRTSRATSAPRSPRGGSQIP